MAKSLVFKGFELRFGVFLEDFELKSMFLVANSIWVSLWCCILHVFGFFFRTSLSSSGKKSTEIAQISSPDETATEFAQIRSDFDEGAVENETGEVGSDLVEKKEIPKLDSEVGSVSSASTSKYQFFTGNSLSAFIEEPEIVSYTVQEMFVFSNDESHYLDDFVLSHSPPKSDFVGSSANLIDVFINGDEIVDSSSSEVDDFGELSEEDVVLEQGKSESSVCGLSGEEQEAVGIIEDELDDRRNLSDVDESSLGEHELYEEENDIMNVDERIPNEHVCEDVKPSVSNSDDFWASIHKFDDFSSSDYVSDEMLCDKSPGDTLEPETPMGSDKRVDFDEDSPISSYDSSLEQSNSHLGLTEVESEPEDMESTYIEIEPQNITSYFKRQVSRDEFSDSDDEDEFDQENSTFDSSKGGIDASESCDVEDEQDQTESDVLLEQKELIRQMKKETRHLKTSGLPTILEESESPRVEDDLRPLKIDEKIGHKDRMDELQTLYKKYLDKMRKLDILSQQTMYAIGLLQLKNQDQFALNKKVSVPVIKSLLAQNFWSYKLRKQEADPLQKLIKDFRRDLELVYVGQLCLSWEILKWQHHKSEELHTHDPDGFRQHSQVAGEFQKFEVLLQRFTEDEPFHHGPRVQHYVKSRCRLPNLLQVPIIKDDPRGEWRAKGEGGISIGMLKEVIGASMRAFWEFVHADKDEFHAMNLMSIHGVQVDLQDPSDMELLTEVRSCLQKKEKRLKDLVRSGNCIVRKFQKHHDQKLSHEMFLAQVELRLVSRVLSMSRLTTDQLLWCHKKMSKINIIGRKVYLDSSFLLFPC